MCRSCALARKILFCQFQYGCRRRISLQPCFKFAYTIAPIQPIYLGLARTRAIKFGSEAADGQLSFYRFECARVDKSLDRKFSYRKVRIDNVTSKECHFISFPVAEKVIYMQGLQQTAPQLEEQGTCFHHNSTVVLSIFQ